MNQALKVVPTGDATGCTYESINQIGECAVMVKACPNGAVVTAWDGFVEHGEDLAAVLNEGGGIVLKIQREFGPTVTRLQYHEAEALFLALKAYYFDAP